ncbi:kelch-like protein 2 isoform X4 [Branchiostoma floridae]|uniref:Kelch-like protein 2 isoform X4 n=1 Tax=Branchiostoma floridae TaxID=7739 RepID=A0A9J7MHQ2_BRAFL|nr:kelch-like protein 2 isoform X4 [Branchiostoma floridae]
MNVSNNDHTDEVLRGLDELRRRGELTDVVLEVEGRSFPCHRAVLAACSPYFRGMFTSGYAEAKQERVSIQDVSEVAMATILNYAYTGFFHAEPDQVQAVMSAAKLLQIEFVSRKVAKYMKNHLDVSNCADVLMYADMLGDLTLKEASVRYITNRFNQVALQPSFLQLPLPLLQSLLNMDDLMVDSEDVVVQAALRWVDFNQEERMQHLPALCKSFRHCFISSDQLVELESKCLPTGCKLVYSDITTQRVWQTRTEMPIILGDFAFISSKKRNAVCCDPLKGKLYEMRMPDHLQSYSVAVTPTDDLYMAGYIDRGSRKKGMKKFLQFNHQENTWESRCDLTTPRDSFPCHRNVLASCSPYFRGMFTSGYVEAKQEKITIKEVSKVAMATILDYAYTGSLKMEPDQVQDVMSAAGLLQVEFVGRQAAEYMKNHLDVSNCADVLIYADMLGDLSLQETSMNFIASRFNQVALQPSFLQLPLSLLQSLLNREDLMTSSEDNIVQAALRWVDFNQEERLQHLPALCRCFRDSAISSELLAELETTPNDELYLAGGISSRTSQPIKQKALYQYNYQLNTWEPRCDMESPRVRCGLVYLKGYIYAIGGDNAKESAERYDPSCDEWTSIPAIPQSMSSELCAVTLDDSIYVVSKEGCYCFSTTENKWNKIADMIKPPLRPQAVTYQGCIYCMDSDKDWGDSARTCIEMYNPANGEWKQSGNGKSFVFDTATLVKHGGSLYIFMVQIIGAHDCWIVVGLPKKSLTYVNQYHPETDSWLNVTDKDSLVLPSTLMKWLGSGNTGNRTDCLVARMIPQCLGKRTLVEDLVAEMFPDEEEESNDSSDSSGSGISDDSDSEDDLSYQEDSDEDNSHEDGQSGSDEEDV